MIGDAVYAHMQSHPDAGLSMRPATWRDAWRLWLWRNHETTRRMMVDTQPIPFLSHCRWLRRTLRDPKMRLFVAFSEDGTPVGSGRVDFTVFREAQLSVVVAPSARGRGFGTTLVLMLVAYCDAIEIRTCLALVRQENTASMRAFSRAGFVRAGRRQGFTMMARRLSPKVLR